MFRDVAIVSSETDGTHRADATGWLVPRQAAFARLTTSRSNRAVLRDVDGNGIVLRQPGWLGTAAAPPYTARRSA